MNGKPAAYRWLKESGLDSNDSPDYSREAEYMVMIRLMIAQGKARDVLGLLERMRQAALADGRMRTVIEILLLQAMANYTQGQFTQAFMALERALSLSKAEDYIRLFVDEGRALALLLTKWRDWKVGQHAGETEAIVAKSYLDKLLSAVGRQHAPKTSTLFSASQNERVPVLMEPLGERELEVLRYLAAGLSNQAIAEAMVVALSTVKSHLKSIYRKLEVDSRTQAVARARELHLL
jgi:LuxR family maltose regulon positive regulatory protein